MKEEELLNLLVDLARRLEFDIRFDRGSFRDGACRLQGKKVIVLNRISPTTKKITALSRALADQPLDDVYLLPVVREAIENAKENEPQLSLERHHG